MFLCLLISLLSHWSLLQACASDKGFYTLEPNDAASLPFLLQILECISLPFFNGPKPSSSPLNPGPCRTPYAFNPQTISTQIPNPSVAFWGFRASDCLRSHCPNQLTTYCFSCNPESSNPSPETPQASSSSAAPQLNEEPPHIEVWN